MLAAQYQTMCSLLKELVSVPGPALPLSVRGLRSHHLVVGVASAHSIVILKVEEFGRYSKRRVYECLPVFGPVSEANHVDLVLKIDSVYEQFTLEALENFRHRLKEILHLSQSVLRLCRVDKGCFQLTFQVPLFVQQEIFPLSSEQERALVAEGVIKLTCGNYKFITKVCASWLQHANEINYT